MKKISLKTGIVTIMLMCFGIGVSQAQSREERPQEPPTFSVLLEKMDTDKDGKLSAKEVKGPLKDHFTKADANEDGFISEEEFKKMPKLKGRKQKRS